MITMDFMFGLPRIPKRHDFISMIVDWITKLAHFMPVCTTDSVKKLVKLYVREIVQLHEILATIVSNWDARFTSALWKQLQPVLRTQLRFSMPSHPETDGQIE